MAKIIWYPRVMYIVRLKRVNLVIIVRDVNVVERLKIYMIQ